MSTVFRVEKNANYTVMSNCHLKDRRLSLKAKGLFSVILSLPEEWDYTLGGLAAISKESRDAIRTAIVELEELGYVYRRQTRDERGKLASNEYLVYECPEKNPYFNCGNNSGSGKSGAESPQRTKLKKVPRTVTNGVAKPFSPSLENPTTAKCSADYPLLENPSTDNPTTENPSTENPTTATYNILNKNKSNTYSINQSINQTDRIDRIDCPPNSDFSFSELKKENSEAERNSYRNLILTNIEYECIADDDKVQVNEMVNIMVDIICSKSRVVRANGSALPIETVRSRFLSLEKPHIEYVLDAMKRCAPDVRNIRSYLITTLFNAPVTIDNYYGAMANHDIRTGKI